MLYMKPFNEIQFNGCLDTADFIEPVWLDGWDDQSSWAADLGQFLERRRKVYPHGEPSYRHLSAAAPSRELHR